MKKWLRFFKIMGFTALLLCGFSTTTTLANAGADSKSGPVQGFAGEHAPLWHLQADDALLIGGYGDNFSYDGSRVTPLLGTAKIRMNAATDRGTGIVRLEGSITPEKGVTYSGDIKMVFRIKKGGPAYHEGGVADFIYLHGATGQGEPVMPKSRTFLASWGSADVYVNGQQVYRNLMGHIMYTEGTRDKISRAVYNADKSAPFSPKDPSNGSIAAPTSRELHFVAHDMSKDGGNFPPHSVFIHLNFARVTEIK